VQVKPQSVLFLLIMISSPRYARPRIWWR